MPIELGILNDGRVMMVTDHPLPDIVRRVEFYREQRLFQLVYKKEDLGEQLMECEIPQNMVMPLEKSPNVVIMTVMEGLKPYAYKAPLVKVGNLF